MALTGQTRPDVNVLVLIIEHEFSKNVKDSCQ